MIEHIIIAMLAVFGAYMVVALIGTLILMGCAYYVIWKICNGR